MTLQDALDAKGLNDIDITYHLRIHYPAYLSRMCQKTRWTAGEREKLRELLEMSEEDIERLIPKVRNEKKHANELTGLKIELKDSGLGMQKIADSLGIAKVTLYNKINGRTYFTDVEKIALGDLLGKTASEMSELIPVVRPTLWRLGVKNDT